MTVTAFGPRAATTICSRGRDVSHYQGRVNWKAERADGVVWAMAKATEGLGFTDSEFAYNWLAIAFARIVRGAYHYADPGLSPELQAQRFVNVVKPKAGRDFLCLDLEKAPTWMSQGQVRAWRQRFSAEIRRLAPGVTYVIYVGGYAHNGSGAGIGPDECDAWMFPEYPGIGSWPSSFTPRLGVNTTGFRVPIIWQFSYTVRGFDASVATVTGPELPALAAGKPTPLPASKDEPVQTRDYFKSTVQAIPANVWTNVSWDVDGKGTYLPGIFASLGGHAQCSAGVLLSGPANGQLRFVEADPTTGAIEAHRGIARTFRAGELTLGIDRTFATTKGQHFYLQIVVDTPVSILAGNVTALQFAA